MKKFYCFTAGQLVPKWVVDFVSKDPESEFNNKKAKIRFITSCIGVRDGKNQVKLMRLKNDKTPDHLHAYIQITKMTNADAGGVGKGAGISVCGTNHQHIFGESKKYNLSIVNGKEVLQQEESSVLLS
ncbi:hypothetical protein CF8_0073 [Aeromonas phage CF8]|nr:hypothetical protein CF8_0073 [Aeromonas phage CF8]